MRISDWSSDVCSSDLLPPHRGERGIDLAQVGFDGAQADSHFGGYIALEDAVDAETAKDARGPLAGGGNRLFDERELLTRDERSLRSEEHTSELQSLMRNSYAVFCLKKKTNPTLTTRKP